MNSGIVIRRAIETKQDMSLAVDCGLSQLKKRYVSAFAFLLNLLVVNDLVRMLFNSHGTVVSIFQYLTHGIALLLALGYFICFKSEKAKYAIVVIISILLCLVGISSQCVGGFRFFISNYFPVLFSRIVPALIFTMLIDGKTSKHLLLYELVKYRYLWIVYSLVGAIYISRNSVSWGQYAGNYGFNLLLPFSLSFYNLLKNLREFHISKVLGNKRTAIRNGAIKWVFYSLFFLVFIVLRGSRTAFLCAGVFIVIFLLFSGLVSKRRIRIILFFLLAMVILLFVLFQQITTLLSQLFPSSRTIQLLSSGLSSDSGRGDISKLFLSEIFKKPFAFRGLFSDRFFYTAQADVPFDITNYPHNFFIEILFQFGLIFGPILIILLAYLFIRTSLILAKRRFQNSNLSFLFYFFFASGVFRLISTGSYLTTFEFFAFIGISFKILILSKTRNNSPIINL